MKPPLNPINNYNGSPNNLNLISKGSYNANSSVNDRVSRGSIQNVYEISK